MNQKQVKKMRRAARVAGQNSLLDQKKVVQGMKDTWNGSTTQERHDSGMHRVPKSTIKEQK